MISPVKRIADARERRLARGGDLAGQRFERVAGARTGHAHDRNRRRRRGRRRGRRWWGVEAQASRQTEALRGGGGQEPDTKLQPHLGITTKDPYLW